MTSPTLPAPVGTLAARLAELPGVCAVVLGGSRATGASRTDSDWDLGVYYRPASASIDPEDVRALGYVGSVSELGEWGPIVHGGGWLKTDGTDVDVLFRDLDRIDAWWADARAGSFDVLLQPGYVVGAPTYLPVGERAVCLPIHGELEQPEFPSALQASAPTVWEGKAGAALMFAEGYAGLGDVTCCTGQLIQAVLCAGHARLAAREVWVLNEKRLVESAGLDAAQGLLARPGHTPAELAATVAAISELVRVDRLAKG